MFNTTLLYNLYDKLLASKISDSLFDAAYLANEWFDRRNVQDSLDAIILSLLSPKMVDSFAAAYDHSDCSDKSVTIVMAGNIPFVGCADLLYALLCDYGNIYVKLSSKDYVTMNYLIETIESCDGYNNNIKMYCGESSSKLIATGSDNSGRYFRYNFRAAQSLIRSNRSSIAVVKEGASDSEIESLWSDIFLRYGLGCRNITKIFIPSGFNVSRFKTLWSSKKIDSKHYNNIYLQQRALLTLTKSEYVDLGYAVMVDSSSLFSQLSVVNYSYYSGFEQVVKYVEQNKDILQCVLYSDTNFGQAQFPSLFDYADGVDVMKFLLEK